MNVELVHFETTVDPLTGTMNSSHLQKTPAFNKGPASVPACTRVDTVHPEGIFVVVTPAHACKSCNLRTNMSHSMLSHDIQ